MSEKCTPLLDASAPTSGYLVDPEGPPSGALVAAVPFLETNLDSAAAWLVASAADSAVVGQSVRLLNAYCVTLARPGTPYGALVTGAGLNLPDGAPVAWLMRRMGASRARQVRGPSLFWRVLDEGRAAGLRHFLFGATPEALRMLIERMEAELPGVRLSGSASPSFSPDAAELAAELPPEVVRQSTDIVWVGLGSPKQDFVAAAITADRGVWTAAVGAAFDFSAGTIREAPIALQRMGLEWLFRLAVDPRRLWRRYLVGNPVFVWLAVAQLVGRRRRQKAADLPITDGMLRGDPVPVPTLPNTLASLMPLPTTDALTSPRQVLRAAADALGAAGDERFVPDATTPEQHEP